MADAVVLNVSLPLNQCTHFLEVTMFSGELTVKTDLMSSAHKCVMMRNHHIMMELYKD
jgi:hypothetical protein